jgi:hypothetical protein
MNTKLYTELYNFVDRINAELRQLSSENLELVVSTGLIDALDKVYDIVEREGLGKLEDTTSKL